MQIKRSVGMVFFPVIAGDQIHFVTNLRLNDRPVRLRVKACLALVYVEYIYIIRKERINSLGRLAPEIDDNPAVQVGIF